MKLSFTKMQGCANDYIYLDCRASGVPADIAALAQRLSARHFSVGADGIICICAPVTPGADGRMRIFNADGSEAQMCGNGVRCVAEWLYTHGMEKPVLTIDTNSGVKRISRQGAQLWQVEMGAYSTLSADLPAIHMGEGPLVDQPLTVEGKVWKVTCISVGNPHCVTVVEDVDSLKLEAIGPAFEHHANFPERINTEFVQVVDAAHLKMRVWERGSGETWACGTGACAAAVAAVIAGNTDPSVPINGAELTLFGAAGKRLSDNEIDQLVRGGVTPIETVGGVSSPVRGITTKTSSGGAADTTWRELTTILIVDEVIPTIRTSLRARFARSKNTAQSRGAIRSQVVLELEEMKSREIVDSYGEVKVSALKSDPTVCLVEFSFTVAHGLNRIYLTAHITV